MAWRSACSSASCSTAWRSRFSWKATNWFRPWSLARYMATSALRMSDSGDAVGLSAKAMPQEAVTKILPPSRVTGSASWARKRSAAAAAAASFGMRLQTTMNSSPPNLPSVSPGRSGASNRAATSCSKRVAERVTHGVVDDLEAIEVDEQHRHPGPEPPGTHQRVIDAVLQQGTVGQAGEVVVEGLVLERRLEPSTLDGDGGQVERPIEEVGLEVREATVLGVEDGERAEQLARAGREDRCGPAQDEPVIGEGVGRAEGGVGPQVVHERLTVGGAHVEAGVGIGGELVEQGDEVTRQPRCRAHPDHPVGIEDPDRAVGAGDHALDHLGDLLQRDLERRPSGDRLEQLGLLGEEVLDDAAPGDVAEVDDQPAHGGVVGEVGDRGIHDAPRPVPVTDADLVVRGAEPGDGGAEPTVDRDLERVGDVLDVVGVQEVAGIGAEEVLRGELEHALDRGAHVAHEAVGIDHDDEVRAAAHQGLGEDVPVAELLLDVGPLGHVDGGDEQAADGGMLEVVDRLEAHLAVRPVTVRQADRALERLVLPGDQPLEVGRHRRLVVGVQELVGIGADQLPGAVAEAFGDRRRDPPDLGPAVDDPHQVRDRAHDGVGPLAPPPPRRLRRGQGGEVVVRRDVPGRRGRRR